jgi:ADP-ribosylglycohydrolase
VNRDDSDGDEEDEEDIRNGNLDPLERNLEKSLKKNEKNQKRIEHINHPITQTPSAGSNQTENGRILRIECIDFMCHEHLIVDFKSQVTFISGANGSGESAVVAALLVALGLRANKAGRGETLQNFVCTGSDGPATVRVHLRNVGHFAYQPRSMEKQ